MYKPSLVFLSELQLAQCDLNLRTSAFRGEYSFSLNSYDLYEKDAAKSSHRYGGTMVMWMKKFDAHVTVHPVNTSAFLPIIITEPGFVASIHICIYLPTQGKEDRFLADLSSLNTCISEMRMLYPGALFYLRGDFNTSRTNLQRSGVLEYFIERNSFTSVPISHTTYHHFVGDGLSDSHLDQLLHTNSGNTSEIVSAIICKLSNPLVNSHHDVLISEVRIPNLNEKALDTSQNVSAPKLDNTRT